MIYLLLAAIIVLFSVTAYMWYSIVYSKFFDLTESIPDALLLVSKSGRIKRANNNAVKLFGYEKDEFKELIVEDLIPHRFRDMHVHQRKEFFYNPEIRPMGMGRDLYILRKDGSEFPAEIALSPISGKCFFLSNLKTFFKSSDVVVLLHDISERKKSEEIIHKLAYYDQLTQLPNRLSFYERSRSIISHAKGRKGNIVFMMIDIRDMKRINDTLGHYVGDDIIQKTAHMLQNYAETHNKEDCEHISLFRVGGDEFLYIIKCAHKTDEAEEIAQELLDLFEEPIDIDGVKLDMSVNLNIGISVMPSHGMNTSQLLKSADVAMIKSKTIGKGIYTFYRDNIYDEYENFSYYESAIKYFIKTQDFDIHYQPIWDIHDGRYVGAEVLFRSNVRIYPDMNIEFLINVAETTGLIVPLGNAILERACAVGVENDVFESGMVVSVNASVHQIEEKGFVENVVDILESANVEPENIAIEITETTFMQRERRVVEKLEQLKKDGIHVYIDDFGKGFSSMALLKNMPVDKLKIDIEFLNNIETDPHAVEILKGIINLGQALGLIVCSEGVETQGQYEILERLGCDQIQGFYKGKPVPIEEFKELCLTEGQKNNGDEH